MSENGRIVDEDLEALVGPVRDQLTRIERRLELLDLERKDLVAQRQRRQAVLRVLEPPKEVAKKTSKEAAKRTTKKQISDATVDEMYELITTKETWPEGITAPTLQSRGWWRWSDQSTRNGLTELHEQGRLVLASVGTGGRRTYNLVR